MSRLILQQFISGNCHYGVKKHTIPRVVRAALELPSLDCPRSGNIDLHALDCPRAKITHQPGPAMIKGGYGHPEATPRPP